MHQEQKSDNMASPQNSPPDPNSTPYPPNPNSAPYPPSYPNSAPQYGQPQTIHNVVVNSQPPMIGVSQVPAPYKDYFGFSIFNLLCCCSPLGIVALIYSCKTQGSLARGDLASASSESRTTFILNVVALVVGIIVNITWIALVSYYTTRVYYYPYSNSTPYG